MATADFNLHTHERQRDLFPLPLVPEFPKRISKSRTLHRTRTKKLHSQKLVNEVIRGLNNLCGCVQPAVGAPTASQRLCMDRIRDSVVESGAPPTSFDEAQALALLCQECPIYSDGSKVASFDEAHVAFPPECSCAVPARELTSAAVSEVLNG